jgi:hypothetical protein
VVLFPAVRRIPLIAAAAALLAAPALAQAGPVTALPPAKPPALTQVAPGISYQRAAQGDGQVIHVVRASPSPRVSLAPVEPGGSPVARGSLTSAVGARMNSGAVAGINGDFFSPTTNEPSGVLMINGELIRDPEASRSSLVMLPGGGIDAIKLAFQGRLQATDVAGAVTATRSILGVNRPAKRGSETLLYTAAYGALTTPAGGSRYELRVRLDVDGPILAGQPRTGTVVGAGSGGGMTIGAGHVVITGVGSSGPALVSGFPLGQPVTITPGILSLPPGALNAIGGGPALVRGGQAITNAGEGFTGSQVDSRTARSAVGQAADGTTMFVTVEGPQQGRPGMTAAEQARMMQSLGAVTAIATDAGGSAQLAVRDQLVIPWGSAPRALADVVVMSYDGVTVQPLPYRVSANNDRVDDTASVVFRATRPGVTKVSIARTTGRPARNLWQGTLGPGAAIVKVDPKKLRFGDGPYVVIATQTAADGSGVTEERRRVIFDRTIGSLTARPATSRVGKRSVPRLDIGFKLVRTARVTVRIRSLSGTPIATIASGRRLSAGSKSISWNRMVKGKVFSGTVQVTAESRTSYGTSGLVRAVTLKAPPKPKKASPAKP